MCAGSNTDQRRQAAGRTNSAKVAFHTIRPAADQERLRRGLERLVLDFPRRADQTVTRTSSEDDGSARAVHPLSATLQSRLASLIDDYLPFSTR
jgi:hypothetical protein